MAPKKKFKYYNKGHDVYFSEPFNPDRAGPSSSSSSAENIEEYGAVGGTSPSRRDTEFDLGASTSTSASELESRLESQLEARLDSRRDSRLDSRLESQLEQRLESQLEQRLESHLDSRLDPRLESHLPHSLRAGPSFHDSRHVAAVAAAAARVTEMAHHHHIQQQLHQQQQLAQKKKQQCRLCANHNQQVDMKGHKHYCPYVHCECEFCEITKMRQHYMKKQQQITRRQNQEHQFRQDVSPSSYRAENEAMTSSSDEILCREFPASRREEMERDLANIDDVPLLEKINELCKNRSRKQ